VRNTEGEPKLGGGKPGEEWTLRTQAVKRRETLKEALVAFEQRAGDKQLRTLQERRSK
jgi:hypothetical protein